MRPFPTLPRWVLSASEVVRQKRTFPRKYERKGLFTTSVRRTLMLKKCSKIKYATPWQLTPNY